VRSEIIINKNKMNHKHRLVSIVFVATIAFATSCKKHNDVVAKPVINAQTTVDTVTLGEKLTLHPSLVNAANATFSWTVGGAMSGTDSTFTFTPTARGDFQLVFTATNSGGSTNVTYQVHVYGKYENGFFVVNEGWFGHGGGTVSFYRYDTKALEDSVFAKENPGKDLGSNTTTMEFGTVYNNKLYVLTKGGGPLVAMDAFSLKETGRIASGSNNDFRAMVPLDTTKALVSTGNGIFPLNLQTLTLGAALTSITGEADDMVKAGNYIFVLDGNGLDILKSSDYTLAKNVPNATMGFAVAMDGTVWAAGDSDLIRIDPSSLAVSEVKLPFEINGTFGFWHPGSMTASTSENAIFIGYNTAFTGAMKIYKYQIGTAASVSTPFINVAAGKELYDAGMGYDKAKNQLVLTTVMSGYGTNYATNDLYLLNAGTGTVTGDVSYSGYFFPATPVFH
jgi:Domain of unknown function (DUF5074)/PKD-like domain